MIEYYTPINWNKIAEKRQTTALAENVIFYLNRYLS